MLSEIKMHCVYSIPLICKFYKPNKHDLVWDDLFLKNLCLLLCLPALPLAL